jgi:hypothetical protein
MAMTSIVQILKVNETRRGNKDGRDWAMQDCECALLNEAGEVEEVGVLMLPKDLTDKVRTGTFIGSFSLRADRSREGQRRILAQLTGLQPYAAKK